MWASVTSVWSYEAVSMTTVPCVVFDILLAVQTLLLLVAQT
jgi:hypothetical protein